MPALADWVIAICAVIANVLTFIILTQKQNSKIDEKFDFVKKDFNDVKLQLTELTAGTVGRLEGDIKRLTSDLELARVDKDKWVDELRKRTHDLVAEQQKLVIQIDRLERRKE